MVCTEGRVEAARALVDAGADINLEGVEWVESNLTVDGIQVRTLRVPLLLWIAISSKYTCASLDSCTRASIHIVS